MERRLVSEENDALEPAQQLQPIGGGDAEDPEETLDKSDKEAIAAISSAIDANISRSLLLRRCRRLLLKAPPGLPTNYH